MLFEDVEGLGEGEVFGDDSGLLGEIEGDVVDVDETVNEVYGRK